MSTAAQDRDLSAPEVFPTAQQPRIGETGGKGGKGGFRDLFAFVDLLYFFYLYFFLLGGMSWRPWLRFDKVSAQTEAPGPVSCQIS